MLNQKRFLKSELVNYCCLQNSAANTFHLFVPRILHVEPVDESHQSSSYEKPNHDTHDDLWLVLPVFLRVCKQKGFGCRRKTHTRRPAAVQTRQTRAPLRHGRHESAMMPCCLAESRTLSGLEGWLILQRVCRSCLFGLLLSAACGQSFCSLPFINALLQRPHGIRSNFTPSASSYKQTGLCESLELIIEWSWQGLVTSRIICVLNTELSWCQRKRKGGEKKQTQKSYLYHSPPQKLKPNINKLEMKKEKKEINSHMNTWKQTPAVRLKTDECANPFGLFSTNWKTAAWFWIFRETSVRVVQPS